MRALRWYKTSPGVVLLAGVLLWGASPAGAVTIELNDVAADRVERQRAYAEGALPLPGTPDLANLSQRLEEKGLRIGAPVFIRIFKAESQLEVWMRQGNGFVLLDTYPICHWSGTIGPKQSEGDRQNPEGFYTVGLRQLHRSGRWPHSLNLGFPNGYDRALSRTGSYILVHGGCSSIGCFAMTDAVMEEIYKLARAALRAGQYRVHVHVFPFRMTEENLAAHAESPWFEFWQDLKQGYDAFAATSLPPRIGVCDRRYVAEPAGPEAADENSAAVRCGALRTAAQGAGQPPSAVETPRGSRDLGAGTYAPTDSGPERQPLSPHPKPERRRAAATVDRLVQSGASELLEAVSAAASWRD